MNAFFQVILRQYPNHFLDKFCSLKTRDTNRADKIFYVLNLILVYRDCVMHTGKNKKN